jgi:hypothetical protein
MPILRIIRFKSIIYGLHFNCLFLFTLQFALQF